MIEKRLSYRIDNDMKCFNVIIYKRNSNLMHNNNFIRFETYIRWHYEGRDRTIIASITANPIMYVETFKTNVIVFIDDFLI